MRFWNSRIRLLEEVEDEDVAEVGLDGAAAGAGGDVGRELVAVAVGVLEPSTGRA
jgi:hypothetical protein